MTYLRGRGIQEPAVKLAIMANMCDYDVRIDTRKVRCYQSLITAAMALALKNGDVSVLNPDLYESHGETSTPTLFGWCPPFKEKLLISTYLRGTQSRCPRITNVYHIAKHGLKCPAILWKVEQRVDLSEVRADRMLQSRWEMFRRLNIHDEKFQPVEDLISPIFLAIIRHLHNSGKTKLAKSIWISIRCDDPEAARFDYNDRLPEDVETLLANETLLQRPVSLMQLHSNKIVGFQQLWLLERVMRDGAIWYVQAQPRKSEEQKRQDRQERFAEGRPILSKIQDSSHSKAQRNELRLPGEINRRQSNHESTTTDMGRSGISFSMRTPFSRTLMETFRTLPNDNRALISPGAFYTVMTGLIAASDGIRNVVEYDLAGEEAIFDVDGPCLIAVPFDACLERFPHPPERCMRVCWLVDHAPKPGVSLTDLVVPVETKEEDKEEDKEEKAKAEQIMARLKAALDKAHAKMTEKFGAKVAAWKQHESQIQPWPKSQAVLNQDRCRVMGKVRGFWPIMERSPWSSYLFV